MFEELNSVISKKEIIGEYDRLKMETLLGIDLLVNEYFIDSKEDLLPFIHVIVLSYSFSNSIYVFISSTDNLINLHIYQ